jgi:hypothetical protein
MLEDPIQKRLKAHGIMVPSADTYQTGAQNVTDPIAERLKVHGIDPEQQSAPEVDDQGPAPSGTPPLSIVLADPSFQALSPQDQMSVRRKFYQAVARDPDFQKLSPADRQDIARRILSGGPNGQSSVNAAPGEPLN